MIGTDCSPAASTGGGTTPAPQPGNTTPPASTAHSRSAARDGLLPERALPVQECSFCGLAERKASDLCEGLLARGKLGSEQVALVRSLVLGSEFDNGPVHSNEMVRATTPTGNRDDRDDRNSFISDATMPPDVRSGKPREER